MKQLHSLIEDKQLNVEQLAKRIGMSVDELQYKLNQGKEIDVQTAYKLSQELNVTLDYLYNIL